MKLGAFEAWEWLREGGRYEDLPVWYMPYLRSVNHFNNPLVPLEDAGFSGIWGSGFLKGASTVAWSQETAGAQSPGGQYSWYDVRGYFRDALTAGNATAREEALAETFRGLGQLMHLVQDMSVPEHTRNDGHYRKAYEDYVKRNPSRIDTAVAIAVADPSKRFALSELSQPSPFSEAPVPIARLFDTERYNGNNPEVTTTPNIGLAEYTNANFLSGDTMFAGFFSTSFPYPSKATSVKGVDLDISDPINPGSTVKRPYYLKVADGETGLDGKGYLLAGQDYLAVYREMVPDPGPEDIEIIPPMDDYVFADYARLLLPRAVGYSATLLHYFFRGQLDVIPASEGLQVKNSGSEEMTSYDDPSGDEIGQISIYYDDTDKIRHSLATYDLLVPLAPGETTPVIFFDPPSNNVEPGRYIVVFHGKLGQEEGAVIGKVTAPQKMYYVSVRSGIYKIYSMKTDGSAPTVVYDNPDAALKIGKLALSPDGTTLALMVNGPQIYLLNIATGSPTFLTNGGWPAWSPDGKKLAFSREMGRHFPNADEHIFTRDVETGSETQLTDTTVFAYNSTPAWSPDGGKIAYMTSDPNAANCVNYYAISIMDTAGNPIGPLTCAETNYWDETPAWSPDGSEIAFSRRREGKYSQLHKINVATHELTKLTDSTGDDYAEFTPSWFPERGKIAVGSKIDGDFDIWLVDGNGGGYIENLTESNPDIDGYPTFEP